MSAHVTCTCTVRELRECELTVVDEGGDDELAGDSPGEELGVREAAVPDGGVEVVQGEHVPAQQSNGALQVEPPREVARDAAKHHGSYVRICLYICEESGG